MMLSLVETIAALDARATTSVALVEQTLAAIANPQGEGGRTFTRVYADAALRDAHEADRRRLGGERGSLLGVPVSIKDLFDVEGDVTTAGSRVLEGEPPAAVDAEIVQALKRAGAVIVGRTNMTEFAFSGVGINPHFGTPLNPYGRETQRIPGGSSSGAAISVTDGMCVAAVGTDTGGSVRIPAALCGLVGFKPTQRRVSLDGTLPLSSSLDSIGPIARNVADCRVIDEVLSGRGIGQGDVADIRSLRFLVPEDYVLDGLDDHVSRYFDQALSRLSAVGASIQYAPLPELSTIPQLHAAGTFPGYEGYALHRSRLAENGDLYDPRVRARLLAASQWTAENYDKLKRGRLAFIQSVNAATKNFDALLMPTVPIIAPPIATFDDEDTFHRINLLLLRNPTIVNLLDGCAISVPCHRAGDAPVGLMIVGKNGADDLILSVGEQIERMLSAIRN